MSSERARQWVSTVLAAMADRGLTTDPLIVAAGGPSTTTLTKYRNALAHGTELTTPREDVFRRVDVAAGWTPGSARRLWHEGAEPKRQPVVDYFWGGGQVDGAPGEAGQAGAGDWSAAIRTLLDVIADLRAENAVLRLQVENLEEAAEQHEVKPEVFERFRAVAQDGDPADAEKVDEIARKAREDQLGDQD